MPDQPPTPPPESPPPEDATLANTRPAGDETWSMPALPGGADGVTSPAPANEFIGDFEVLGKLGQGGMGAVYRARQTSLDRLVALKVLSTRREDDEDFVIRFQREARVAASLSHPNLVKVYASGEAHGTHFIAMELIEGETLGQRLKRSGALPPPEALRICLEVARALEHAWRTAHLIHRDIKPGNIFLSEKGDVKLGDLGLAKSMSSDTTGLTHTGVAMGTPHYISPEQARGDKDLDFRADLYSLGCTLYQMLTGRTPYEGRDPLSVMNMHLNAAPPAILKVLPGCPIPLARLVGKMLKKARRERQASYEDLIAQIESVRALFAPADSPLEATLPPDLDATLLQTPFSAGAPLTPRVLPSTVLPATRPKSKAPLFGGVAAVVILPVIAFFVWPKEEKLTQAQLYAQKKATEQTARTAEAPATPSPIAKAAPSVAPAPAVTRGGRLRGWVSPDAVRGAPLNLEPAEGLDDLVQLALNDPGNWVARRADGRVVVGNRAKIALEIEDITDATSVRGGGPLAVLRADGTVAGTFLRYEDWQLDAPLPTGVRDFNVSYANGIFLLASGEVAFRIWKDADKTAARTRHFTTVINQRRDHIAVSLADASQGAVLRADGSVLIFRPDGTTTEPPEFREVTAIANNSHWLGLRKDGRVVALGENKVGQASVPADLGKAIAVRANYGLSAAQMEDGTWRAWGDNSKGVVDQINRLGPAVDLQFNATGWVFWIEPGAPPMAKGTPGDSGESFGIAGRRYQLVGGNFDYDWPTARAKAEAMDGQLAVFETEAEEVAVRGRLREPLAQSGKGYWIGALAEAQSRDIRWITGEPVGPLAWRVGHPGWRFDEKSSNFETFGQLPAALAIASLDTENRWMTIQPRNKDRLGFLVEWPAPGPTSPATATREAPFVNSLGMQFVPVPITGGPTDGKRVLFSVWETRVQDYATFVKETGHSQWKGPSSSTPSTVAAVFMSWEDARAFCRWLTERERQVGQIGPREEYRLPTDHEWSCAIGLGEREDPAKLPAEKSRVLDGFPWGSAWPPPAGFGNYSGSEAADHLLWPEQKMIPDYRDAFPKIAPVGSFAPNDWGLYDLGGNVHELAGDYYSATRELTLTRGGSYSSDQALFLKSSTRGTAGLTGNRGDVGFRVVLAPTP